MCILIISFLDPELTLPGLLSFPGMNGDFNLAQLIGPNQTFGIILLDDKEGVKMDAIENDIKKCEDINREVLKQWMQGKGLPVAWSNLIKALRNCGKEDLATKIQAATIYQSA